MFKHINIPNVGYFSVTENSAKGRHRCVGMRPLLTEESTRPITEEKQRYINEIQQRIMRKPNDR